MTANEEWLVMFSTCKQKAFSCKRMTCEKSRKAKRKAIIHHKRRKKSHSPNHTPLGDCSMGLLEAAGKQLRLTGDRCHMLNEVAWREAACHRLNKPRGRNLSHKHIPVF